MLNSNSLAKAIYKSPKGDLFLIANEKGLIGLYFDNHSNAPQWTKEVKIKDHPVFAKVIKWLDDYFKGKKPLINFDLHINGTTIQNKVWNFLKEIPYGQTCTYKQLGDKLKEKGFKVPPIFVGSMVARNPISIIIPCHRVIGTNGSLTGFAGGLEFKKFLLDLEKK